jgi:hypothetical protein
VSAEALWKQIWTRPGEATVQIGVDERIREQVDELLVSWLEMKNDNFTLLEIDIRVSAQNQAREDYEQEDYDD